MEILNVKEISRYLKVSISTIRRLILKNQIPFFRISNQIFFNKEIINEWIKKQVELNLERKL